MSIDLQSLSQKDLESLYSSVQKELARREKQSGTSLSPLNAQTEEICIVFKGKPDYNEPESVLTFRTRRNAPLHWVTKQYSKKTFNRDGSLKFTVEKTGEVIWGDMTANDAKLADGDIIRVTMQK